MPGLHSRLFTAVPQCDFDDIDMSRVNIYGDDFHYLSAEGYHAASSDNQSWQDCEQELYREMEHMGRARAHHERKKMVKAIVESPHNVMVVPTFVPDVVIGCALDVHAYYIYSLSSDSLWVNGWESEPVVEMMMTGSACMYPSGMGTRQLKQAARKLFWNVEFTFKFSAALQARAEYPH